MIATPLQVICIAHRDDSETEAFLSAVRDAFSGEGGRPGSYLSAGGDTGIPTLVFRPASQPDARGNGPVPLPDVVLDSAWHTLVLLVCDRGLVEDQDVLVSLAKLAATIAASNGRHHLVIFSLDERGQRALGKDRPHLESIQVGSIQTLGESAIRPPYVALFTLDAANRLLRAGAGLSPGSGKDVLEFFISHAKMDALALAASLRHQLDQLPWFRSFYDAKDIQPGDDWRKALEEGVHRSMLLVLRTDIYDQRFWCRQEVMWAEENACPMLVVDARTQLVYPACSLPLSSVPTVRLPDGNLIRLLSESLREWVRISAAQRQIVELERTPGVSLGFLPRVPSLASLASLCLRLRALGRPSDTTIIHLDPPLETGSLEAAALLVRHYFPAGSIRTLKDYLASCI